MYVAASMANGRVQEEPEMGQRQAASSRAESYAWEVEIECFLPQRAIDDLGIRIGSYHHGYPLPSPFPAGWTAERDGSLC
jgi:hypothetical protein